MTGPNRIVIADRWDDLMDGTLDTALQDADVMSPGNWYSGSAADGTLDSDSCSGSKTWVQPHRACLPGW